MTNGVADELSDLTDGKTLTRRELLAVRQVLDDEIKRRAIELGKRQHDEAVAEVERANRLREALNAKR